MVNVFTILIHHLFLVVLGNERLQLKKSITVLTSFKMVLQVGEYNQAVWAKFKGFHSTAFHYIYIPLKIAYHVFVIPFNINVDTQRREVILESSYARKVSYNTRAADT